MKIYSKKTTLFVGFILLACQVFAQSLSTGSVHFPPQKMYLPNGYTSTGADGHTADYEVSYNNASGSGGIDMVWLDIRFSNNTNTRYCFTRPNGDIDCYRRTGGIERLNALVQPVDPALVYIDFTYDIFYKGKFVRSTGDNSNKYMDIASTEPITVQIKLPASEVNKTTKLEEVLKNLSIKNLKIREYTYSSKVKAYLLDLAELDFSIIEEQRKQAETVEKKAHFAKVAQLKKPELDLKKTNVAKEVAIKTVEIEQPKPQLPTKPLAENRIANVQPKAEDTRMTDEKPKEEDNRIAEEKRNLEEKLRATEEKLRLSEEKIRNTESKRLADEKRKADDNRMAKEKRKVDEKPQVTEEKRRIAEARPVKKAKLDEVRAKSVPVDMVQPNPILTVIDLPHVNRLRLGAKVGLPNLIGGSFEYVLPIPSNRLSIVADYTTFSVSNLLSEYLEFDKDIISTTYDYLAFGTNIYLNRRKRGGGPYLGLRYQNLSLKTTLIADKTLNGTVNQNAAALLFGASTSGHVWVGVEIGGGLLIGNITGSVIEDDKTRTAVDDPLVLPYVGRILPTLNLKLGFAF
jgi:hypothetical protein